MKKALCSICACLLFAAALTACGAAAQPAETPPVSQAPPATETPVPTPRPMIRVGDGEYSPEIHGLILDAPDADTLQELCQRADEFPSLQSIILRGVSLTTEQLLALREAFPKAALQYQLSLFGQEVPGDTRTLSLRNCTPEEIDGALLVQAAQLLDELTLIDLSDDVRTETVKDRYDRDVDVELEPYWSLEELAALRAALPERVRLECRFRLFDQTLDSQMTEIIYEKAGLKNEDLDTVRTAFPLLPDCTRFVMDNCGPQYEALAELREEYPDKGVVWRVHFRGDSILTDAHSLWSVCIDDANCYRLNYCTEMEYIDIGHDEAINTISFTAYMPHLKVLICALTDIKDISPLANCPELEYLEIFGTQVRDLSPLTNCTKLEHLNISTLYAHDITPIYGLTNLKRLWVVNSGGIPREQLDEFQRLVPDCEVCRYAENPTEGGWRRDKNGMVPRYALLREQIGYWYYNSPNDKIDWEKSWQPGYA